MSKLPYIHLQVGTEYEAELADGTKKRFTVHGSRAGANNVTEWEVTVDGQTGWFADLNDAVWKNVGYKSIRTV